MGLLPLSFGCLMINLLFSKKLRHVLGWSLSFKLVLLVSSELCTVEIFEACLAFTSWCKAPSATWWQVVSAAVCEEGLVDCRWHGWVWRQAHVSCERSYWIIQNRFHLRLLLSSSSCPIIMFMSAWFDQLKIVLCWYLNSTNHQEKIVVENKKNLQRRSAAIHERSQLRSKSCQRRRTTSPMTIYWEKVLGIPWILQTA